MFARHAHIFQSIVVLTLAACSGLSDAGPPAEIRIASGDQQVAPAGTPLRDPLTVVVLDERGTPTTSIPVTWHTSAGTLTPDGSVTDRQGRASAQWMLAPVEGAQQAFAEIEGVGVVTFTATAEPLGTLPFDELRPMTLATYDGSGQVVHPDHATVPALAFGAAHQLAITPYPFGNARYENPSLFSGHAADLWRVKEGVPNPIVLPSTGHLSDPDIVYVPETEELWLYYRHVTDHNIILLMRSRDGREWSAPLEVLRAPNHEIVSPSIVRRAPDDWWMFSVNSGRIGCGASATKVEVRRSTDGIHWNSPTVADLVQPNLSPWHIDVQWVASRGAFWAVYNAKAAGGCTTPALFLATSTDGASWTVAPNPLLVKGTIPEFQDIVYRGTFAYDQASDALTFWHSGARYADGQYIWSAAVERKRRVDLFAPALKKSATIPDTPAPAPLTDWP